MYLLPPYVASLIFGWSLFGADTNDHVIGTIDVSNILDFSALAVILAGVFLVSRYRVALEVSQASAQAWHDERDAAVAKSDRLAELVLENKARITALEAQPSLAKMESLLQSLLDGQTHTAEILAATVRPNP